MQHARSACCAVQLDEGRILVIGGDVDQVESASTEVLGLADYDTAANKGARPTVINPTDK